MDRQHNVTTPGKSRRVHVRKARPDAFTAAKRQVYLDTLAMCCTVSAAAKAAGVSVTTIRYHRHRDESFAAAEAQALEEGYFALEAASVAHAARGGRYVPGDAADPDAPSAEALEPEIALRLLALKARGIGKRTGDGGQRARRVTERELNESILAKLEILGRRRSPRGRGEGMKKHEARKLKTRAQAKAAMGAGAGARSPDSPSPRPSPLKGRGGDARSQ